MKGWVPYHMYSMQVVAMPDFKIYEFKYTIKSCHHGLNDSNIEFNDFYFDWDKTNCRSIIVNALIFQITRSFSLSK